MTDALTISELLTNATSLHGQVVTARGFFIYERERIALFAAAERDRSVDSAVWLVHPATVHGEASTKALTRKWVMLTGIFESRRQNPHQGYPGLITAITAFELAP